jgi:hypothetical protein
MKVVSGPRIVQLMKDGKRLQSYLDENGKYRKIYDATIDVCSLASEVECGDSAFYTRKWFKISDIFSQKMTYGAVRTERERNEWCKCALKFLLYNSQNNI